MRVLTACDEHQHVDTKCWVGAPTEYRASKSHQEHDTSCKRDHDIEANAGAERRHYLQLSRLTCSRLALRQAWAMLREMSATSRPARVMWAARQRVDLDRPFLLALWPQVFEQSIAAIQPVATVVARRRVQLLATG